MLNVDLKANKYSFKCMKVVYLVYIVVWILDMLNIFIVDKNIVNRGLIGGGIILAAGFLTRRLIGFEKSYSKYIVIFLMVSMFSYYNMILSYHALLVMLFPMICSAQYHNRKITIYVYILTVMGTAFAVIYGFRNGLLDANMLLLTTSTAERHIPEYLSGNFELNESIGNLVLFYVVPRAMITAASIPLLNHVTRDIEDYAKREAVQKKLAETDGLTGLLNKGAFISQAMYIYDNERVESAAFIFLDLDHFKDVNDRLGHDIGDKAIVDAATIIKNTFRKEDLLGRFGGDEFTVFLKDIPYEILMDKIEEIVERLRLTYRNEGNEVAISASLGAVYYDEIPEGDFTTLMKLTDQQLYKAKENGRNGYEILRLSRNNQ